MIVPLPSSSPPNQWVHLFNGKDLTGWKTHPTQPGIWRVENGILIGSEQGSHLFTERGDFSDFHLRAEVQIPKTGNSGVYFRCPLALSGRGYPPGFEAQIYNNDATESDPYKTGSILNNVPDSPRGIVMGTEWFTMEVIAQGNHVVTRVNGATVFDGVPPPSDARYLRAGHFALQSLLGPPVRFRKIEIKELSPGSLSPTYKNDIGMEFVIVPKGKSWLGGGKDKPGDRPVTIPRDFYLCGKYLVTQEEWQRIMGKNPSHFSRDGEGKEAVKYLLDANLKRFPVEQVSWDDAQEFLTKLNEREKKEEAGYIACRMQRNGSTPTGADRWPTHPRADFDYYFEKPTNQLLPDQANFEHGKGLKRPCAVG